MKPKVRKQDSGITLIALVITIIVLLILAGVSIATLTGENGILTKTQDAKIANEKVTIKEQLDLAVLTSRINNSGDISIDENKLENELERLKDSNVIDEYENASEDSEVLFTAKKGNYIFDIYKDGNVKLKEGLSLNKNQLTFKIKDGEAKTETLVATQNNINGDITWTSSNTNVATVDNNGTVTTVGEGNCTITATCSGSNASCWVTVSKVEEITFTVGVGSYTALSGMTWREWVTSEYAFTMGVGRTRTFHRRRDWKGVLGLQRRFTSIRKFRLRSCG